MRYEVKLTPQAIGHIEETMQYISKTLLTPETARKWADTLQCEIRKLDSMPSRYPLTEEETWRTKGIRKMPVRNYAGIFFGYWRSFLTARDRVTACGGDILAALRRGAIS